MEPIWYFLDGVTCKGPFSAAELVTALLATSDPRMTKVWREGMGEWERAGTVAELAGKLPPRLPSNRYAVSAAVAATPLDALTSMEDAAPVARLYRRLVLLVGCQILISFGGTLIQATQPSDVAALIALLGLAAQLVIVVLMVITGYGLTKRLDAGAPVLWAIGMLIPLLNILVLLAISSKANAWCKARGIPVGLLGPKLGTQ